jgi:RND family efflux transporter MFP subunit
LTALRERMKWIGPGLVLAAALLASAALLATSKPVGTRAVDRSAATVRVVDVSPASVKLLVRSQGTVSPRIETALIPQVSGPVVWVSPALVSGGFFEQGEILLRIDPLDYEANVARARANLARAQSEYEHGASNLARRERLSKLDAASTAQLDDARRAERVAEAVLKEQRIALAQAKRDLTRTEIHAPFPGRVRDERVDLGQFVSRGAEIATIYSTDFVEVRLPIPDSELAFLDLALWRGVRADGSQGPGPRVVLRARFGGEEHSWTGHVVRTEGEIDAKSRMVHVVAQVESPYEITETGRPPLAVGLFVRAEIDGRNVEDVTTVPRSALRDERRLMVVDAEDRLWLRDVDILRVDREQVFLNTVLAPGERVCISPLQAVIDGMRVRTIGGDSEGARRDPVSPSERPS